MAEWNPSQYERFQQERSQPAYDLMDFISPRNSMRIVDLGCGSGAHTLTLHERFHSGATIGVDSSREMLAKAPRAAGLKFYKADIAEFGGDSEFDLIFSNAALHWVPDHPTLFARFRKALRPGGQIAVQMPKNRLHPTQRIGYELEREPPFDRYPACPLEGNTLEPHEYAALLHSLGFRAIKVRLYVYLHELASGAEAVEWVKGSFLNWYREAQPPEVYAAFEKEYSERVRRAIGTDAPYLLTYNRILMHAVR